MKAPLIDEYIRRAMRDKPDSKYTKRYLQYLERYRAMRELDREMGKFCKPILDFLTRILPC